MAKSAMRKILFHFDDNQPESNNNQEDEADDDTATRTMPSVRQGLETQSFSFVRSQQAIANILEKHAFISSSSLTTSPSAQYNASKQNADDCSIMIIYTLVDPALRQALLQQCQGQTQIVACIDLLGPLFDEMGQFLQQTPAVWPTYQKALSQRGPSATTTSSSSSSSSSSQRPSRRISSSLALSPNYFARMEAVEFTLQADDGRAPWLWPQADVILVGVSRTGKTPLSVVLSHTMGLRVANIPLVLEVPPPPQLLNQNAIDARRVFCLTLAPHILGKIRQNRLERRQVLQQQDKAAAAAAAATPTREDRKSSYADRQYLLQDLMQARRLAQEENWTEIDVTGRAVEETATLVVELLSERFPTMTLNN